MFKLLKEAARFLKKLQKAMTGRPPWLFSSAPLSKGDLVELLDGWRFLKDLQASVDLIHPREIVVFNGALDLDKLKPFEKWVVAKFDSPVGDFRDWEAITAWAKTIAASLKEVGLGGR